jgi:hypothetical protein
MNSDGRAKIKEANILLVKSKTAEIYKVIKDDYYMSIGYVKNETVIELLNNLDVKVCVTDYDDYIIESNF